MMNSLSWLLYFADVLPNISSTIKLIGWTMFAISFIALILLGGFILEDSVIDSEMEKAKSYCKKLFYINILAIMLLASTTIIPSKNTIYAIAVSETGEKILQSEWGKRGGRAIDAWITKQLEESSSKSSK